LVNSRVKALGHTAIANVNSLAKMV